MVLMLIRSFYIYICVVALLLTGCGRYSRYSAQIISAQIANASNQGRVPVVVSDGDTVKADAYAIALNLKSVIIKRDGNKDVQGETKFSLTNNAVGASIYSVGFFDSMHRAGSCINDCFSFINDTLAYKLNRLDSNSFYAKWTFHSNPATTDTFHSTNYFVLQKKPAVTGRYSFAITVQYADSTNLSDTLNVYLK
jgi:hypothetical protein